MSENGFDERLSQASNNNAVRGLNDAQAKGRERSDSGVLRRSDALAGARRDKPSGLDSSKSSNNISNILGSSSQQKSSSPINNKSSNLSNSNVRGNTKRTGLSSNPVTSVVAKKNPAAGVALNTLSKRKNGKVVPGVTTAGRIVNALNKGKNAVSRGVASFSGQASKVDDAGDTQEEKTNPEEDSAKEVEQVTLTLSKKVIRVLIVIVSILPVLFIVLLGALIMTDTIQKLVLKMVINGVFNQGKSKEEIFEDSVSDIDEDGNNSGEFMTDDDAFIVRKDFKIYLSENDNQKLKFSEVKSASDIDLSGLKDYYKLSCDGDECEKEPSFMFYRKMYDLYFLYKYKYNVKLDLALLGATLDYNSVDMDEMMRRNVNNYDVDKVRENGYNNENITELDWEYDYKNIDGYNYLNANDFRYDMQILAKNMVTKKIKYSCTAGGKSVTSSSKKITDNSNKGDGWSSITKVKYDNGVERTFRNYKQYDNGNSYWSKSYRDGNIADSGCGPSSIAIILSGYGYDYNPGNVIDKFNQLGITYTNSNNLVSALKSLGISAERHDCTNTIETINVIRNNFKAGRPIMIGTHNHWVTYLGENEDGLIISDPGRSDGDHYRYGRTVEELVKTASDGSYILIKSNGSATKKNTKKNKNTAKRKESSTTLDDDSVRDIETSNYDSELKCSEGSVDLSSIEVSYELDKDKYDEFLLEYLEHKFYLKGSEVDENTSEGESTNTVVSKTGQEAIDKMTEIGLKEQGNHGSKYRSWFYGHDINVDWCAIFVSWLFNQVGGTGKYIKSYAGPGDIPRLSGTGTWFESEYSSSKTVPKAGDVVLFTFNGLGHYSGNDKYFSDHVGYVYKVDDNYIYTIEGNTGTYDSSTSYVATHQYERKSGDINGYYRPKY